MPYKIGQQQVIRQVSDGPRHGLVRPGTTTNYYVRTGIGMQHCDPEFRLRPAQKASPPPETQVYGYPVTG